VALQEDIMPALLPWARKLRVEQPGPL